MSELTGFVAYPTVPGVIGETIRQALTQFRERSGQQGFSSWEETDVAGNFIRSGILKRIGESDCLVADVSGLNFNVTYEVGYAIGLEKRHWVRLAWMNGGGCKSRMEPAGGNHKS